MKTWLTQVSEAEGFQWDGGNTTKNLSKHQVGCTEAEQIFFNRPLLLLDDPKHSDVEIRVKAFGRTDAQRLLTVSFTFREKLIRIISARPMNRKEKKQYEKQGKN